MRSDEPSIIVYVVETIVCIALALCLSANPQLFGETNTGGQAVAEVSRMYTGYITFRDGNLILDDVEIIMGTDEDRMEELNLSWQDMMSGYYLYNQDESTYTFNLTDETKYCFVDIGQLYTSLEENGDLDYETLSLAEFVEGSSYGNNTFGNSQAYFPTGRIPYFVEVVGDSVVSVTEEFMYTI